MPSWRIHLITGFIITTFLIFGCHYLDLWYPFIDENKIQYFFWLQIGFVSLLGSLLPDYDYRKTRIRHALGFMLGLFVIVSYLYIKRNELQSVNYESLLFILLVFIIISFLIGFAVPFKHHGKMHSGAACIIYAITCFLVEYLVFEMSVLQAGMIGGFGFIGFASHLLLDGDLKMI